MTSRRDGAARILITAAALVVVVAGLKAAAPILVPLLLALFIALVSYPLLAWLGSRGWPNFLAVLGTLLVDGLVLTGFGFLVVRAVGQFVEAAPDYVQQLKQLTVATLQELAVHGVIPAEWARPELIQPQSVLDVAGGVLGGTLAGVASTFLFVTFVFLYMLFLLGEASGLPAKLELAFGPRLQAARWIAGIVGDVQRYLLVKTWLNLLLGVLLGVWLAILNVEFVLLWAILAFLLHYIPNIGIILAAVPPALQALLQHNPGRMLLVLAGYLVVGMVIGNLLEPQIMGRRFGFSSLIVLLSLVLFGWIWGPVGALLSVPLLVVLRVLAENSEQFRWLAVLLGRGQPAEGPTGRGGTGGP